MATAVQVDVPIPATMRELPISKRGFLVPWFVKWIDGEPDFRVMDPKKLREAVAFNKCWMCGGQLKGGVTYPFTVGPMCIVNRVSSEPPSHADCARYAAQVCPFLARPHARRRDIDTPTHVAGIAITRNPGVVALAFARSYEITQDSTGVLFRFAKPIAVEWYCEGRKATRAEVVRSIETGLPEVASIVEVQGPEAIDSFERDVKFAQKYLPRA